MVTIRGVKHWLWRAVDQHGAVLDVLVQRRRHATAVKRLMRKLLKRHGRPRVMMTDKLRSYAAANTALGQGIEHRQHEGLNNRAEDSHQPTRVREKVMRRFKSAQPAAAIYLGSRPGCEPVHGVSLSSRRATETRGASPGDGGLGKGVVRPLGGVSQSISATTASSPPPSEQPDSTWREGAAGESGEDGATARAMARPDCVPVSVTEVGFAIFPVPQRIAVLRITLVEPARQAAPLRVARADQR